MTNPAIQIFSEIGPLKRVLLHRPGHELENLMPEYIERLLFDDIPYLKIAREEHDAFCGVLRANGAEVVYLEDLAAEALADPDVKDDFLLGMDRAYPDRAEFAHVEGNSAAHLKTSAVGPSQTVIIEDGKLLLGIWQGIYFCEFDGPRTRRCYVKILGE